MGFVDDVEKHVLCQVFRFGSISENSHSDPMDEAEMTPEKNTKGFSIRRSNAEEEMFIGHCCWVLPSVPGRYDGVRPILSERQ